MSRTLSQDALARRAVVQGLLNVWQHGHNVTLDPIVVFAIGSSDVVELADRGDCERADDLDRAIRSRVASLLAFLRHLVGLRFTNLYLLGTSSATVYSEREAVVAARFDRALESVARDAGIVFVNSGEPEETIERVLADRLRRRSQPLAGEDRIDVRRGGSA